MHKSITFSTCLASGILCLSLLASCSKDSDPVDTALPPSKYPISFTTGVEELAVSRSSATADGQWTESDEVAMQIDGEVKQYVTTGTGNSVGLTGKDAGNTFYWNSTGETKTVRAWYYGTGYSYSQSATWTVKEDQSGGGYQQSDFLYAGPKDISFGDRTTTKLTFRHQTARVVINIVNADAVTDAAHIASVSIENTNTTAGYTASTAETSTGTWSGHSTAGPITPKEIATPGSYLKSYAALVIPQDMTGTKFIAVTLSNGNTYYYTPENDDGNLLNGTQHRYDITVKNGYLEVTASSSGEWGKDVEETVTSKELKDGLSPADLKIGDYYYSDGTTSDGGYRKYGDGTTGWVDVNPVLKSTDGQERTVIGIVYSTDTDRIGEAAKKALADKGVTIPHGLVMALTNASESCRWGEFYKEENASGAAGTPFRDNTDNVNKMYLNVDGYGETQYIIETYKDDGTKLLDIYTAFYHASRYGTAESGTSQYAAPATTTGWFIPSVGQWWDVLSNLGGVDLEGDKDKRDGYLSKKDASNVVVANINKRLEKISDAKKFKLHTFFWLSSEYSNAKACGAYFGHDGDLRLFYNSKIGGLNKVRCFFAF